MHVRLKVLLLLIAVSFLMGCTRESGERLFDMVYPNTRFVIPAGLSAGLPRVVERQVISNIDFYLSESMVDTARIIAINPFSATMRSLDGNDYDFIREISVRICDAGTNPCTVADEVFFIDRIENRAGEEVNLLPTLKNARRNLLRDEFKMEIVFFLAFTSPFNVESQFDMVFQAVE